MPSHYNTLGGGNNNPIVEVNLQAQPGQFVFQQSGLPYTGLYHRHQNGELMIGAGQMGVNHELKPNEIIVSANQTRGFGDDLGIDTFDPEGGGMNRLGQQGNQTAGFGDDLGYDGYDPEGFGDDLGIDGYDPERKGGSMKKHLKKNQGGMLQGPSHEQGGIPAIVGGTTPVELEGGEYIINAQTVNAVGQEFLDELNSTQTTYHQGGFEQGELPPPSQFKNGGKVVRRNKRTRPVPTRRKGGRPVPRQTKRRTKPRKMAHGGMHGSCPPGMMMGQNGGCVPMSTMSSGMGSGGYRKGGKLRRGRGKKMQTGGPVPTNTEIRTRQTSFNQVGVGRIARNAVGTRIRQTKGGPTGGGRHQHTIQVDNSANGHTSTHTDGHAHKIVNGRVQMACPQGIGCHSHQF